MTTFDKQTEKEIAIFSLTEKYIKTLKWSKDSDDYIKTLVIGNIRGFFQWLYRNGFINMDKVQ
jgi:site-specific recombinase XerD